MKLKNTIITLTALSIGVMTTSIVLAHGNATGVVKERMDAMEAIGKANMALSVMFKGETDYDASKVEAAARVIRDHAGEAITKLFPEGSGGMPSEALPAIWEDWSTFGVLAGDLATYSTALAAAADNPRGAPWAGKTPKGQGMMGQGMMGQGMTSGGMMSGAGPDAAMLASMPPDAIYMHVTQTCSSCHTKFRQEKK